MSIFSDFMCRAARDGNLDEVIHLLQVSKNERNVIKRDMMIMYYCNTAYGTQKTLCVSLMHSLIGYICA